MNRDKPVVIFDGECGFCNRFVAFALRSDVRGELLFASNLSEFGRALCEQHGVAPEIAHTIVVVVGDKALLRSDAVASIAQHLKWPYSLLRYTALVPRFIRDGVYRLVAAIRRALPGRRDACAVLPPELRARIIE